MFSPSLMSLAPERSDVGDGKGQMKPEVRSPDHSFHLKRKWSSTEEKGGQEGREDHKRAKSGELLSLCTRTHALSQAAARVSYLVCDHVSI